MTSVFETKIEFLKGVGPQRAQWLGKELGVFTFGDLIQHFPFRYEDRTKVYRISEIRSDAEAIQLKGTVTRVQTLGVGRKQRFVAHLRDETGTIELIWFKGVSYMQKMVQPGVEYLVFAKPNIFKGKVSFPHPEIEIYTPGTLENYSRLQPVYPLTESLKKKHIDSKAITKMLQALLQKILHEIPESLPEYITSKYGFLTKKEALLNIHFPKSDGDLKKAQARLKFEELFFVQLKLFKEKTVRRNVFRGRVFENIDLFNKFYKESLPFDLTDAQKRVIKEIRKDLNSGEQMNRLLQGDVGSGKTIVAFLCMLMAVSNDSQASLMAPTEILAQQHYAGLKPFADALGLPIALLTGSTKTAERKVIHQMLRDGDLPILIGTHALLEDKVQFKSLGLCVVDEQHRFGVAQRAKLWKKGKEVYPHILVMTATPIPRTLAMTVYGDLDVSVIDELPAGRKPIQTAHKYDSNRLWIFGLIEDQIKQGRQAYIVYPLIEESEKLDLKDLMDGFESVNRAFPDYQISIVHGKMKPEAKEFEMQRFIKGETKIMVATTVIEVGVNVPNATIMVIENAERFGLAQLHQLRGRVGRGGDQSYCVLATDVKLSKDARTRMQTMVKTNNGFEIAEVDLRLRGPGDMSGTQQSGVLDLLIADISKDSHILKEARVLADRIIERDPQLEHETNVPLKRHIASLRKSTVNWGRIS